jgi:lysophospholipase L1-like esterase
MRKNKIITILFCCFTALLLSACAKTEVKNVGSKGKNIICFGDSLTFGYGANLQEDFPSLLTKMTDRPVINAGVDGDTTFTALNRLQSDVLSNDPYLVILEFCGNDFIKKISRDDTINNLREMISAPDSSYWNTASCSGISPGKRGRSSCPRCWGVY